MKRAITLAGGGPAVGLSLGALKCLKKAGIEFDVWALSCIGAWLGVVYNQADPGKEVEQSVDFFRKIFREDRVYSRFPIANAFAPDFVEDSIALFRHMVDPRSYSNLVLPDKIMEAAEAVYSYMGDPRKWSQSNFNSLMLNQILAVNPMARFMTSLIYKSPVHGLARIYYPDSALLNEIRFDRLYEKNKPFIYHNTYNMTDQRLEHFANRPHPQYQGLITAQTLCACSALPFIEEPVEMNGKTYCEGATIDTVSFYRLIQDHPDLDEVWVSRILDHKQIRKPENLYDALNNLVMLFASTVSEDDVKLFKYHLAESGNTHIKVIELKVSSRANYDWTYSNLDACMEYGCLAAQEALADYKPAPSKKGPPKLQLADA